MFYLSTFVICAVDEKDANLKIAELSEETEDRGLANVDTQNPELEIERARSEA